MFPNPTLEALTLDLPKNVFAGTVSGLMSVIASISYASLIFSGTLPSTVNLGICSALTGSIVIGIVLALRSSSPFLIAGPDANISAIMAIMVASVSTGLGSTSGEGVQFSNILVLMVLTTSATGLFFFFLGRFQLGRWIRFIPYAVVGGFLAGTGWLLIRGSFSVMTGIPLCFDRLPVLVRYQYVQQWVPGVLFGFTLFMVLRRCRHFLLMPLFMLGGLVFINAGLRFSSSLNPGIPIERWFLTPLPNDFIAQNLRLFSFSGIEWRLFIGELGHFVALMIVASIVVLLNAASVEITTDTEMDLDQELLSTGMANFVAAWTGGLVGCIALSRTILNWKAGGTRRVSGVVAALFSAGILFWGSSILSVIPIPLLGGLLFYLGLNLFVEWLFDGWFRLSNFEYFLVVTIVIIIGVYGFLLGVGIGLGAACVLFAYNYSKISVIKQELTGTQHRSNIERSPSEYKILKKHGDRVSILRLQGYLFFGTAYPLLTFLRNRIKCLGLTLRRFLLLDFSGVSGLDSSAVLTFTKIKHLCEIECVELIFVGLSPKVTRLLEEGGCLIGVQAEKDNEPRKASCHLFPDLDYALGWCEEQILESEMSRRETCVVLGDLFNEFFDDNTSISDYRSYLEKVEVPRGHILFRQGEVSRDFYLVESGVVTAFMELPDGRKKRMRTMGPGTVVGEMGYYLGKPRSGTTVVERDAVLYRLTDESFSKMEQDEPRLASAIHRFLVRLLATRLADSTAVLVNLLA